MGDRGLQPVGNLPQLLSAIGTDLLAEFGIPGGSSLGHAIKSLFHSRVEKAQQILFEELRQGDKKLTDVRELEEVAAIIYRYARAAQEGAARLNLRLMAKVIAGQAHVGNLVADEFLYYADLLALLRREEVILISTLHRNRTMFEEDRINEGMTWSKSSEELIPDVFASEAEMRAIAQGAARTGLIASGVTVEGSSVWVSTPLMDRIERLAPFEVALRDELN